MTLGRTIATINHHIYKNMYQLRSLIWTHPVWFSLLHTLVLGIPVKLVVVVIVVVSLLIAIFGPDFATINT